MTTRGGDADGPADPQQALSLPSRPLSIVQGQWAYYQTNFLATKSEFPKLAWSLRLAWALVKNPCLWTRLENTELVPPRGQDTYLCVP